MATESRSDGHWNIKLKRGDTLGRRIALTDSDGATVDLSSYTMKMHIRENRPDATLVLEASVNDDDAATGIFVVGLTATQTKTLTKPKYKFDVDLINGTEVTGYLYGEIEVFENAVRT